MCAAIMMLHNPSRESASSISSYVPMSRQNTMNSQDGTRSARASKRYSMTALYLSMNANQRDLEIDDELARGIPWPEGVDMPRLTDPSDSAKALRDLKTAISTQSKKNFIHERDVRYLDSRIALLVQNRMALEEVCVLVC